MNIAGWEERYQENAGIAEGGQIIPTPLLMKAVAPVTPGRALDLASGTGRNALWLAQQGWTVTAVDGSATAVTILQKRAAELGISVQTVVADLKKGEYDIAPESWDLVAICYYLQRDLIEDAKRAVRAGGLLLMIVHITDPGEEPTESRLRPGELEEYFAGWQILHRYEGKPEDPEHRRWVAEIVAQRR